VGRIVGARSSDAVLLTAHLDSVVESPGATDDGSGVGALLESARALETGRPLQNTVMFLFTDFEEGGTVGARAFIADHPWAKDVRIVIGFDAGGLKGPDTLSATSANNGWLIRQLALADAYITGSSAINTLAASGTDFGQAFKSAGFPGYAFDLYWDRRIHTPEDNIDNVNLSSLQHQGYHALALARHFGNLDKLADPKEPDAVYFSVLRLFIVTYSSTWAIPIAITITALFLGVLAFGLRRRILTWGGMAYGMLVGLAGLLIAPLPVILLGGWISGVPIRYASRSLDQPIEVAAVMIVAFALITLWFVLSSRIKRMDLTDLSMGALVPMLVGMLGISMALPALSFALAWPLLFSLLAYTNWFYGYARQEGQGAVILGLLLTGAANIIILVPTILLGMFDQPSLTLFLLGVLCGFLLPLIHLMLGQPIASPNEIL